MWSTIASMRLSFFKYSAVGLIFLIACKEPAQSDQCCVFADLPATTTASGDVGAIQVTGSTGGYYDVIDSKGKPVLRRKLNETVQVSAGLYEVKVNGSTHTLEVAEGRLAKCATGTLLLSGGVEARYAVSDTLNRSMVSEVLGQPVSLFPGSYRASVNNTGMLVSVKAAELTSVRTGTLVVLGNTAESYYVLDDNHEQLGYAVIKTPLAFLPGAYLVTVNNTSVKAAVVAGGRTELQTGSILVRGLTDEYYYATDSTGNALNYQHINEMLAFFPGQYTISVNNTAVQAQVRERETTELVTGGLVLNGDGSTYYYVLDEEGNQLASSTLNTSLSLFPAHYAVKLGASVQLAAVIPGELTAVNMGE